MTCSITLLGDDGLPDRDLASLLPIRYLTRESSMAYAAARGCIQAARVSRAAGQYEAARFDVEDARRWRRRARALRKAGR